MDSTGKTEENSRDDAENTPKVPYSEDTASPSHLADTIEDVLSAHAAAQPEGVVSVVEVLGVLDIVRHRILQSAFTNQKEN